MSIELWLGYVLTVLLLMSTPGPSQLLMLSNSLSQGFPRSIYVALGDLSANVLQMLAAGLGLVTLFVTWGDAFFYIKWMGVSYLIYMGLRQIRASFKASNLALNSHKKTGKRMWLDGFFTSATNPRAILFFGSLFPQFIHPEKPLAPQLLILGGTYIFMDGVILCTYGKIAHWMAGKISGRPAGLKGQVAGGFLILAAVLLGLKEVS